MKRADFIVCYEQGRRYHSRHFILFAARQTEEQTWKAGTAVSRKSGKAIVRNRIKRVLREFFRLNQEMLPPAVSIVAVPKRHLNVEALTLSMLSQELLPLLQRIRGDNYPHHSEPGSQGQT